MTQAELDVIKAMHKRTTGGDWLYDPQNGEIVAIQKNSDRLERIHVGKMATAENARWVIAVHHDAYGLFAAVENLRAEIDARDGLLHDMQQDTEAYLLGKREAFRQVLDMLRFYRGKEDTSDATDDPAEVLGRIQAANHFIDEVLVLAGLKNGQNFTPMPPDKAREEAVRLRRVLSRIANVSAPEGRATGKTIGTLASVIQLARKTLGENELR